MFEESFLAARKVIGYVSRLHLIHPLFNTVDELQRQNYALHRDMASDEHLTGIAKGQLQAAPRSYAQQSTASTYVATWQGDMATILDPRE